MSSILQEPAEGAKLDIRNAFLAAMHVIKIQSAQDSLICCIYLREGIQLREQCREAAT